MKKIILVLLILLPMFAHSQQTEWNAAAKAYAEKDYQQAAVLYESLFEYGTSADLYYNYANTQFKVDSLAKAILYYERALKLDPSHEDAKFNLEFVNMKITDRIDVLEPFFLSSWLSLLELCFTSNAWAYMSVVFFVTFLSLLLFYLFSKSRLIRKVSFFKALVVLLLFVVSFTYSLTTKSSEIEQAAAIVMSGVVSVKSSPADSGTELFVLHEGTKVEIRSTLGEWHEVEIADGNSGWMKSIDLERI